MPTNQGQHSYEPPRTGPGSVRRRKPVPIVLATLVVTECVSLAAGLVIAVLASRPDGGFSLAARFVDEPSFLVELAISFAVVNVFLSGFALAFLATRGFGRVDRR